MKHFGQAAPRPRRMCRGPSGLTDHISQPIEIRASVKLPCLLMDIPLRWESADATSAFWAYLRHKPGPLIRYFRSSIVAVVVSGIVVVQYPESWQTVGGLVLFDAALVAYQILVSKRNANQRFKNSQTMQNVSLIAIDGNSIRLSGQNVRREMQWEEFPAILESRRVFLFVGRRNRVLYIPKSGLAELQVIEVRSLISANARGKVQLASA